MPKFCPNCRSLILGGNYCKRCGWGDKPQVSKPVSPPKQNYYPARREMPVVEEPLFDDDFEIETPAEKSPTVVSQMNPDLPYFPYQPREIQPQIIKDLKSALDEGKHIVIESGTGTGKTIVALSAALAHAIPNGKRVLYITRTITQSDQVMKELKAISNIAPVSGLTVTGRGKSCPHLKSKLPSFDYIPPSVLSKICDEEKKASEDGSGCPYFAGFMSKIQDIESFCKSTFPTSSEFHNYCMSKRVCPYEARKALLSKFNVIVAPYIHVLSDGIRDYFLNNMQSDGSDLVMIVDEAHNIIDSARQQESFTITMALIMNAIDELTTFRQEPMVFRDITLNEFLDELKKIVKNLADTKIIGRDNEALIKQEDITDKLIRTFGLNRENLSSILENISVLGQERTDMLRENGENKVSEILTLGDSLRKWVDSKDDKYVMTVKKDEKDVAVHASCIDPFDVIQFILSVKGVIHMSGTLKPLVQYAKIMCLPTGTPMKEYPSPFPPENRSVVYVGDVTTRYQDLNSNPMMRRKIEDYIVNLCNTVNKNTIVFFPSYRLMKEMRGNIEHRIIKTMYWEEQRNSRATNDAIISFRRNRNGVFFGVMGGSVAEGIDFPGDELCFSIIVGLPFPPPTLEMKGMSEMFDKRFGNGAGWSFASETPMLRKIQQAIGRMIRTETDRGMAVILDSRMSKYAKLLDAKVSFNPIDDAAKFFSK